MNNDEILKQVLDKNFGEIEWNECIEAMKIAAKQNAIAFSDWQKELVFTDKDIWLKKKTTKELYELYLKQL